MNYEEKALDQVGELFRALIVSSGVMLGLIWGFAGTKRAAGVLFSVKVASIVLATAIFLSFLGLQFVVSELERRAKSTGVATLVTKEPTVAACFFAAWVTFLGGCALVVWALFRL
jgi:hypothetical protein